jgi:hypothetical protein
MLDNTRPEFVVETERIYKSFQNEINVLRQCDLSKKTDIKLREIAIAAYVKAYDFVLYICRLNDFKDSFFQLPMLRGICEDLIAITYLINQKEGHKNYLIASKNFDELKRSTKAQEAFLNKYNPGQIVPPVLNDGKKELVLEQYIKAGNLLEEAKFPNVNQMAHHTNLEDLYSFIYHATSKVVHFDIFTLMSTGWGDSDKVSGTIEPNFSYQHDYHHYYKFTLFYSSYLFLQQTDNFSKYLVLPAEIIEKLKELVNGYNQIDWPELVTFRQMNLVPPSNLMRTIFRNLNTEKLEE